MKHEEKNISGSFGVRFGGGNGGKPCGDRDGFGGRRAGECCWKQIEIGDDNEPLLMAINGGSSSSGNTGAGGSGSGGTGGSSGSDTDGTDKEASKKTDQSVTATDITKTYGVKPFPLGAKSSAGSVLSYEVSDPKVATVDASGKVTVKGCGIVDITITAAETSTYKKAQKTITLTVKPKKMTLSSVKKLKAGKKYYVRVCTYAKSGKTKVQGDWSKAKTVKVKK